MHIECLDREANREPAENWFFAFLEKGSIVSGENAEDLLSDYLNVTLYRKSFLVKKNLA